MDEDHWSVDGDDGPHDEGSVVDDTLPRKRMVKKWTPEEVRLQIPHISHIHRIPNAIYSLPLLRTRS
jgi:hypothetical protein